MLDHLSYHKIRVNVFFLLFDTNLSPSRFSGRKFKGVASQKKKKNKTKKKNKSKQKKEQTAVTAELSISCLLLGEAILVELLCLL